MADIRKLPGYQLTEADKALIRGMNYRGRMGQDMTGKIIMPGTNIAALHFDGQVLADMVKGYVEIIELQRLRRWL